MNKIFFDIKKMVSDIPDGATIMVGGFGMCGVPENLITAIYERGVKDLTVISNNCGTNDVGLGVLLKARRIKKVIASYVGENKEFESQFLKGDIEVELTPQGTLAEKIRAGGAGIPAFYTPTGLSTLVSEGGIPIKFDRQGKVLLSSKKKEVRNFKGKSYVLEEALRADFSLIKAFKADNSGNLVFRKTARNFNPMIATAANITLVEVEELVANGEIDPDLVHVPALFVHRLIKGYAYQKPIEHLTVRA